MIVLALFRKERMRITFAKLYEIQADIKINVIGVTAVGSASGIPGMAYCHWWRQANILCLIIEAKDQTMSWRRSPGGGHSRCGKPDDHRFHHDRSFR